MKKIIFLSALFLCLFHIDTYGMDQQKQQHYDKANIENRTNEENFKDYALMTCLQVANQDFKGPIDQDLASSMDNYLEHWVDFNSDDTEKASNDLDAIIILSRKYIRNAKLIKNHPEARANTASCLDFYHSDELNNLMKDFVLNLNKTHR